MRKTKTAITHNRLACVVLLASLACLNVLEALHAKKKPEPYALIFGTVYDANNRPVRGVKVKIARLKGNEKEKTWEHVSDGRGEFAQRVPVGSADYVVWAEVKPAKGRHESNQPEAKVHIENDERRDIALHLTE